MKYNLPLLLATLFLGITTITNAQDKVLWGPDSKFCSVWLFSNETHDKTHIISCDTKNTIATIPRFTHHYFYNGSLVLRNTLKPKKNIVYNCKTKTKSDANIPEKSTHQKNEHDLQKSLDQHLQTTNKCYLSPGGTKAITSFYDYFKHGYLYHLCSVDSKKLNQFLSSDDLTGLKAGAS